MAARWITFYAYSFSVRIRKRGFINSTIPTPWGSVLLEKLTGLQVVKKFQAFYGKKRFITAFITACHLTLS